MLKELKRDNLKQERERKTLGSKQDGPGIFQEREEQDIGELQRRGHDWQILNRILPCGGTQVDVSAPRSENSPA